MSVKIMVTVYSDGNKADDDQDKEVITTIWDTVQHLSSLIERTHSLCMGIMQICLLALKMSIASSKTIPLVTNPHKYHICYCITFHLSHLKNPCPGYAQEINLLTGNVKFLCIMQNHPAPHITT